MFLKFAASVSRLRLERRRLDVSGKDEVMVEADTGKEGGDAKLLVMAVYHSQILGLHNHRDEAVHVGRQLQVVACVCVTDEDTCTRKTKHR